MSYIDEERDPADEAYKQWVESCGSEEVKRIRDTYDAYMAFRAGYWAGADDFRDH